MKYICLSCGKTFEEPLRCADREEYWGAPCERVYYVSPCCKYDYEEDNENGCNSYDHRPIRKRKINVSA